MSTLFPDEAKYKFMEHPLWRIFVSVMIACATFVAYSAFHVFFAFVINLGLLFFIGQFDIKAKKKIQ
jgi:hypothetical protein